MSEGPLELKEYEYYVGHVKLTGMFTKAGAEAIDAKPVGSGAEGPKPGEVPNLENERNASRMAEAEANGVAGDDPDALNKARTQRNRRSQ